MLLGELRVVPTDQARHDLRAALARRPIAKQSGMRPVVFFQAENPSGGRRIQVRSARSKREGACVCDVTH
jgi:hypothetical protein